MRFVLIIVLLLSADAAVWWLSARTLRRARAGRWLRGLCHGFFALQTLYLAVGFVLLPLIMGPAARRGLEWIPSAPQSVIYVWHLVVLPLLLITWLVVGVVRGTRSAVRVARRLISRPPRDAAPPQPASVLSRRSVLVGAIAAVPPLLTLGASAYGLAQNGSFRLRKFDLPVAGLPRALSGFRIAHVSDLHVGRWSSEAFLQEVVRRTNALDADVICFTGDLLDISIADLPRGIEVMRALKARHGLFLIEGNHDLIDDAVGFHVGMARCGLRFLRDASFTLACDGASLQILGMPWLRSEPRMKQSLAALARQRDAGAFPLLLAHHPHAFEAAATLGFPLTLSGHTHGGQFALSRDLSAGDLLFRYISGVYQRGSARLVVSNGVGNWLPLRINAPAEIAEITLLPQLA